MRHKHHILPRHMGGTDDPSNIIELSVEEHAEAHRVLYEQHGCKEDYIAWKALSGALEKQEYIRLRCSLGGKMQGPKNKGWIPSDHTRTIWSIQRTGKIGPNKGKTWKDSQETRKKKSDALKGKPKSENFKRLLGIRKSKTYSIITPEHKLLTVTNMASFCRANGLHAALMYKVATGERVHHRGFKRGDNDHQ